MVGLGAVISRSDFGQVGRPLTDVLVADAYRDPRSGRQPSDRTFKHVPPDYRDKAYA